MPDPARIKTLRLTNFLPFAGEAVIPFEGKNLLVYGENGCGKSALFRALRGVFAVTPTKEYFANVFAPGQPWSVVVEFMDRTVARWDTSSHPTQAGPDYSQRVGRAARRSSFLGYPDLALATDSNVFDVAVGRLLAHYRAPGPGGRVYELRELWQLAADAVPERQTTVALSRANAACTAFNDGMNIALQQLTPRVEKLLGRLDVDGLRVSRFDFPGVVYKTEERGISEKLFRPVIDFHECPLPKPREFLNEARLSALGLALFLAGCLASIPTDSEEDTLKLLVLDDVLIGLDMSHRLPLLALLQEHFADWQIVLMTHDLTWFEVARDHGGSLDWSALSLFPPPGPPPAAPGVVAGVGRRVEATLDGARAFVQDNHLPAAANYARVAFELVLKRLCEVTGATVAFKSTAKDFRTGDLAVALKARACDEGYSALLAALEGALAYRRVVLNPGSHSDPESLGRSEVFGAIRAVGALASVEARGRKTTREILDRVRASLAGKQPTEDCECERVSVRAAFFLKLKDFARERRVNVPYGREPHCARLWKLTVIACPTVNLAAAVLANKPTLFGSSPVDKSKVEGLVAALAPNGDIEFSA